MTVHELHQKITAAKRFLNQEMVKIKTDAISRLGYREIGSHMDMIHEVERIGIRNLSDRETRKVVRMLSMLDAFKVSSN